MKTNYDAFIESVKDITALAELLSAVTTDDDFPWAKWFDKKYCKNCPPIACRDSVSKTILGIESYFRGTVECAYCELIDKCKFFPDLDSIPTEAEVIEMWLREEVRDEND